MSLNSESALESSSLFSVTHGYGDAALGCFGILKERGQISSRRIISGATRPKD
jgi:hypothetical protein